MGGLRVLFDMEVNKVSWNRSLFVFLRRKYLILEKNQEDGKPM